MIFGIIRDGVRSAFVRIVRYIVFAIIALIIFYVIGIFTNKKAHALVAKNLTYQPNAIATNNKKGSYIFTSSSSSNHWFNIPLQNPYTKTNDYDLIAFRFDALNYHVEDEFGNYVWDIILYDHGSYEDGGLNVSPNPWQNGGNGNLITVTGVIWDGSNNAHLCYFAADTPSYLFCPLPNNYVVSKIGLYVTASTPPNHRIVFDYEINNSFYFYNYESTEIINSNGVIIQQQQQTTQTITDSTTTTSQSNATSSLNTISGQFNDVLNGWGGQWSSLTHVVLEPINTVLYAFDSGTTCTPITLTIPYLNDGQTITLPCMSSIYGTYFSGFITVFAMIIGGLYGYRTVMYILRTIKDVIDAENDKIEVIDL